MAVSFRYGPAGSYKSAAAIWFDLLPALREGRLVYTNVEGMQPLDVIEKRLGEKFPDTTRLIRISSRNSVGIELWRNWYNWLPIGAFVLIDECQDIFGKATGFKMDAYGHKPLSEFLDTLPGDHQELFYSRWTPRERVDAGEIDDTGRSQFDDQGRLLYPFDWNGAFMRHRKYNWDIVMCTPDFKQIASEVKGVAEVAKRHRSKDSFFFTKRKPRIFEHDPTSAVTKPQKGDIVYSKKVPLDVHLLYSSTGTGAFTKNNSATSFLNAKVILALLVAVLCAGYSLSHLFSLVLGSEEEVSTEIQNRALPGESLPGETPGNPGIAFPVETNQVHSGVPGRGVPGANADFVAGLDGGLDPFYPIRPYQDIYTTGYQERRGEDFRTRDVYFEVVTDSGRYPVTSEELKFLGVTVVQKSECVVELRAQGRKKLVGCMPMSDRFPRPQRKEPEQQVVLTAAQGAALAQGLPQLPLLGAQSEG